VISGLSSTTPFLFKPLFILLNYHFQLLTLWLHPSTKSVRTNLSKKAVILLMRVGQTRRYNVTIVVDVPTAETLRSLEEMAKLQA